MKKLYLAAIVYLYLPFVVFLFGWTRLLIALPVTLLTGAALYFCYRRLTAELSDTIHFGRLELLLLFILFFGLCVVGGGGDLFIQDGDWHKHHAVLYSLVDYDWPVQYSGDVLLTYYLGQYIVPGFIGRLFAGSHVAAIWAQTVWNALGLWIAYLFTCQYLKVTGKWKRFFVFCIFVLWSGATNLGSFVYQALGNDASLCSYKWIDLNRVKVHFASNFDAIRGAFQHVVTPWICTAIFLNHKKEIAAYVMLALPLLFSATFGFVYFALILVVYAVYEFVRNKEKLRVIRQIFSPENLLLLPLTAVTLIYMGGNIFGDKPGVVGLDLLNMFYFRDFYLIFIAVEFVFYAVFLFREHRKDFLFYVILGELLLMPFISLGMFNDLCSRGSIPARFILMVYCIEQIFKYGAKNWRNFGIALIFLIGAWNTLDEMHVVVITSFEYGIGSEKNINNKIKTFDGYAENPTKRADEAYNYYTLHYSESLFYKIARK